MSSYTKATNFATKDTLPTGDSNKIVKGTEIDNEFNAIAGAISSKADIASPSFTGTPAAPTATSGSNTTQIATTAFVNAAVTDIASSTSTLTNKTINLTSNTLTGTTAQFNTALSDDNFATLAGTETLTNKTLTNPTVTTGSFASPTLTGTPVAPTASVGTNTTQIATTAFVLANFPSVAVVIPAGSVMLFYQASAPTGWTQVTTQNNKALRIVSGTGGGTGGSVDFTTAFTSQSVSGSVGVSGATTLSTAQIPSHTHTYDGPLGGSDAGATGGFASPASGTTGATGGGGSHTHTGGTFTGTAINLAVQYIDVIIASKN